ncbi:azurin [Sphingobacterium daejeonense]|uniref:azurin n=1 Tax=Sphingobacterium daejeonense TaxID=371142 RepID=UPI0010C3D5D5|nr:azurin [Sphingobacterium daejeonense]VTP91748.1 Outer membrane protein H.8 precursor [Sphingobacterium daejeonense]
MELKKKMAVFMTASVLLVSCGENKKTSETTETAIESGNPVNTGAEQRDGKAEIVLSSDDRMRFDLSTIEVFEGQTVQLTLKHTGTMSKQSMGHNFVLLAQGVDVNAFGQKAASASSTEYIPQDETGDIIAYTRLIGGGESDTIEFPALAKGIYDFICSFPGHYGIMKGKFVVK